MDRWVGNVAVVTGASAGIGAAIAIKLAEEGMKCVGLARRPEKVEQLRKNLKTKSGGKLIGMKCDVTNEQEIQTVFKWIKDNLGPIHVLVNNAGVFVKGTFLDNDPTDFKKVLDTNLYGLSVCSQVAMKQMIENNIDGQIIHISSISAHWPLTGNPPIFNIYSPTKFAVKTITEVMRQELAHMNLKIRVSSISPGLVETELFDVAGLERDGQLKDMLMLQPEDIANAAVYVLGTPPNVLIQDLIIRPLLSY